MAEEASSTGYFSSEGRAAALGAAFPLAGTYFKQSGKSRQAVVSLGLGEDQESRTPELVRAIRLRTSIAAAADLAQAVSQVNRRPSFRYERQLTVSRGEVRGTLDLNRLSQGSGPQGASLEFPVRVVRRGYELPENITLCGALLLVHRELDLSREYSSRSYQNTPEIGAAESARDDIERLLATPWLAAVRERTIQELRRGRMLNVAEEARLRIAAGHTASPETYEWVLGWLRRFLEGVPTSVGDATSWVFYGNEFDETLFEIWCLHELRERIALAFGGDPGAWSFGQEQPVLSFVVPPSQARLSLFTQKNPKKTVGLPPRWWREYASHSEQKSQLIGVPDFTITIGTSGPIFLDAKLKNRKGRPTDEIYKMLGYFDNYRDARTNTGVIMYYAKAPNDPRVELLRTVNGDKVLAFSLDPARPRASEEGWSKLMSLLEHAN